MVLQTKVDYPLQNWIVTFFFEIFKILILVEKSFCVFLENFFEAVYNFIKLAFWFGKNKQKFYRP